MIQLIKYEFKKYVIKKYNFYILIALTVLFMGALFLGEGNYFFEKGTRSSFFSKIGTTYSEETKESLISESDKLSESMYHTNAEGELIFDTGAKNRKGKYSESQVQDYELLQSAMECIHINEKRNINTSILTSGTYSKEAAFGGYKKENNHVMVDRQKIQAFIKHMYFGWTSCIYLIILFGFSYSIEREKNIEALLSITQKGEGTVYLVKLLTAFIAVFATNLYFFLIFMMTEFLLVGNWLSIMSSPLFLVDGYEMCASGLTVLPIFLLQMLFSIVLSLLITFLTMFFSRVIRKGNITVFCTLVLLLLGVTIDVLNMGIYQNEFITDSDNWYIISATTFRKILKSDKMLNPFALINIQYYMEQPRFLFFGAKQYPVYILPILISIVLVAVCSVFLVQNRSRRS